MLCWLAFFGFHILYTVMMRLLCAPLFLSLLSLFILWVRVCVPLRLCVYVWTLKHCLHLMGCVPLCECAYVVLRVCYGNNEKYWWKRKRRIYGDDGDGDDGNNNTKSGICVYVHVMAGWLVGWHARAIFFDLSHHSIAYAARFLQIFPSLSKSSLFDWTQTKKNPKSFANTHTAQSHSNTQLSRDGILML